MWTGTVRRMGSAFAPSRLRYCSTGVQSPSPTINSFEMPSMSTILPVLPSYPFELILRPRAPRGQPICQR